MQPMPFIRTWPGPEGRTFLCLHAVGGSHAHWLGVAPRLAEHGRTIAVDLAGFGRTPIGPAGAGLGADRELVSRVLDEHGPAIVVGSSFGGGVALLQAAREPSSVTGLILSGSLLPAGTARDNVRMALIRRRLRQRIDGLRRVGRAYREGMLRLDSDSIHAHLLRSNAAEPKSLDPGVVSEIIATARQAERRPLRAVVQAGASSFGLWTDPARFSRILDRVSCPVLVIHGGCDRTIPVAQARAAVRNRPSWRLHVFDDLAHLPHLEDPHGWMNVVTEWLADR
jgi:pimeloyl-ACP methyl ester carboxylesterase